MSHEIIKSIGINHKTKEVYITGNSNNVYPRTPRRWHCTSLTEMYKTEGLEVLEKEFLYQFMCGNFQRGNSDYAKSLAIFGHPQTGNEKIDYGYSRQAAYENLLKYRAQKKEKCLVKCGLNFVSKVTARRAVLTSNPEQAKIFKKPDAEIILKRFSDHNLTMEAVA